MTTFKDELEQVREIGQRVLIFAGLRYHAAAMGRKPGWAAYFYKGLYGVWPERAWEKVPPIRPSEDLMKTIERRDDRFRFETRMQREREERARQREMFGEKIVEEEDVDAGSEERMVDCETTGSLHEGGEGAGPVPEC